MAYQGEYFIERYGTEAASHTPPITKMLDFDIPVGAGTDATRVASYNPWVSLYWMVAGKTVGGTALYPEKNRLDRSEALRLYTAGSAWFSGEETKKGAIVVGQFADLAVLSADYFSVPDEEIKSIESVLTVVDGKIVHAADEFLIHAPASLPVMPDWSPVKAFGGYYRAGQKSAEPSQVHSACSSGLWQNILNHIPRERAQPMWGLGCDCFAF